MVAASTDSDELAHEQRERRVERDSRNDDTECGHRNLLRSALGSIERQYRISVKTTARRVIRAG
jgi:hypothetical protein